MILSKTKAKTHKISTYALKNLLVAYVEYKILRKEIEIRYESEYDDPVTRSEKIDNDPEYQFYLGSCWVAEDWMNAIGISPECGLVKDMIRKRLKELEGR
jgi:hypothetical protein